MTCACTAKRSSAPSAHGWVFSCRKSATTWWFPGSTMSVPRILPACRWVMLFAKVEGEPISGLAEPVPAHLACRGEAGVEIPLTIMRHRESMSVTVRSTDRDELFEIREYALSAKALRSSTLVARLFSVQGADGCLEGCDQRCSGVCPTPNNDLTVFILDFDIGNRGRVSTMTDGVLVVVEHPQIEIRNRPSVHRRTPQWGRCLCH